MMKKGLIMVLLGIFSHGTWAQEVPVAEIEQTEVLINTYPENSIWVYIKIDFTEELRDFQLEIESLEALNANLDIELKTDLPGYENLKPNISFTANRYGIVFEITDLNEKLIRLMRNDLAGFYIQANKDIFFKVFKPGDPNFDKTVKITRLQIEKATRKNMVLTDLMVEELIEAKGGNLYLTQNKLDFGVVPSDQASSDDTEFIASFRYRTSYSVFKDIPLFLYSEGLVSSNSRDSLNYIAIYPINYKFFGESDEVVGRLGVEGNQVFSSYRVSGSLYWNGIMPNLVDFSFNENRLRLKPVVKAGIKLYQEYDNVRGQDIDNEFSNQIFGEFYYYIPVMKIYSLILEGGANYDFSSNLNPAKDILFNYSLTFGIEVPKTDLKTIFKYSNGENLITQESNEFLLIGLMVDLFQTPIIESYTE